MSLINKNKLREDSRYQSESTGIAVKKSGREAEQLRRQDVWRQAKQVFVGPAPLLAQIRINALLDGKDLIMPGPGLKQGFFLLKPYTVPFPKLSFAVTYAGLGKYGVRLADEELFRLRLDLFVTDALAVDINGFWLGEGHGYFDLSHALLTAKGGVSDAASVFGLVDEPGRLLQGELDVDPWDVPLDRVLHPEGDISFRRPESWQSFIEWDSLSLDRVRKITPLWKLYEQEREGR